MVFLFAAYFCSFFLLIRCSFQGSQVDELKQHKCATSPEKANAKGKGKPKTGSQSSKYSLCLDSKSGHKCANLISAQNIAFVVIQNMGIILQQKTFRPNKINTIFGVT